MRKVRLIECTCTHLLKQSVPGSKVPGTTIYLSEGGWCEGGGSQLHLLLVETVSSAVAVVESTTTKVVLCLKLGARHAACKEYNGVFTRAWLVHYIATAENNVSLVFNSLFQVKFFCHGRLGE